MRAQSCDLKDPLDGTALSLTFLQVIVSDELIVVRAQELNRV